MTYRYLSIIMLILLSTTAFAAERLDLSEQLTDSLVYIEVTQYPFDNQQPWRRAAINEQTCYAAAVAKNQVITTARNVRDAVYIKARRLGQNEFIPAQVKFLDYNVNLCLLELDPNQLVRPLEPLQFKEIFRKGTELDAYWLAGNNKIYSSRGYLDQAKVTSSTTSFTSFLHFIVADSSQQTSLAQVYFDGAAPIGIATWKNGEKETGLIPAQLINQFLADAADGSYQGFGTIGFAASDLLDPAMRKFLNLPGHLQDGVFIEDVYNLGTASDILEPNDCLVAIDEVPINAQGLIEHTDFGQLSFQHLITGKTAGQTIILDIYRQGQKQTISAQVKTFAADEMLVPWHEYDSQPEYYITGGLVLQKLTRPYLTQWGDNWQGRVSPHLCHYFRDLTYKPSPDRKDIVILSYVLPHEINLASKDLGQLVLKKLNGMEITSIADIPAALAADYDSAFHIFEFELENPKIIIPRAQLDQVNRIIAQTYGITKPSNTKSN